MGRESKECVRDKILAAAESRFWHYGIRKTTIDDIAVDAEVGKGTVYLHFESKEQIATTIVAKYKQQTLLEQEQIAGNIAAPLLDRLKRVLSLPVERTNEHCRKSPMVMEIVSVVRLQFPQTMRALLERELGIIRQLLEEGNTSGEMHISNTEEAARLLKTMTMAYMPPAHPMEENRDCVADINEIVEMMYCGLR